MPRIRTIKPEFWTDGDVVELSPYARLLFIGTWNFALCDRGHVADDAKRLKMQVLPADDVDPTELVDELLARGRLERITVDGRTYLFIRRFTDHQRIERRWNPRCPACDGLGLNLAEPHETSREFVRARANSQVLAQTRTTSAQEGKGKEGKGIKTSMSEVASDPDSNPSEDVKQLCQHLADLITRNGNKPPNIGKRWHKACRLMLDVDGHTPEQIRRAIDWSQADPFWSANILSMPKLREKYDTLRAQAASGRGTSRPTVPVPSYETPPAPDPESLPWASAV